VLNKKLFLSAVVLPFNGIDEKKNRSRKASHANAKYFLAVFRLEEWGSEEKNLITFYVFLTFLSSLSVRFFPLLKQDKSRREIKKKVRH
jgi:hypothetical protein